MRISDGMWIPRKETIFTHYAFTWRFCCRHDQKTHGGKEDTVRISLGRFIRILGGLGEECLRGDDSRTRNGCIWLVGTK